MKGRNRNDILIHAALIGVLFLTFIPYLSLLNNSVRTNAEGYVAYFGVPRSLRNMVRIALGEPIELPNDGRRAGDSASSDSPTGDDKEPSDVKTTTTVNPDDDPNSFRYQWREFSLGYRHGWKFIRGYTLNTILIAFATVLGVVAIGSLSGYVFSRYRFPGRKALFLVVLSIMMIPGVLTLVPGFMLVKDLGLLNSYWVLILPYVTGGQVMAIFLFKGFFDGLPEDLFEAARIDGAGHIGLYWNIVVPLSKPIISVVAIMNILGVWNNFLWPFVTNSDNRYHVIPSGLFLLSVTEAAANMCTINAAVILSGIPLLILFAYATKPFMKGVTSGAFKA